MVINKVVYLFKISFGLAIISLALNFFLLPHNIASAGVGAIGHLLELRWSVSSIYTVWFINLFMLVMTYIMLDRQVFSKIFLQPAFSYFLKVIPANQVLFSHMASLIIGSTLFSLGVFFLYKSNSSNGGITIPPIILERYFRIPTHRGLLLTNLVIIFLNFYILRPVDGLFAVLSILIMTFSMKLYTAIDNKWLIREAGNININK
ncbi:YitT family protein [Enterococcus avium]